MKRHNLVFKFVSVLAFTPFCAGAVDYEVPALSGTVVVDGIDSPGEWENCLRIGNYKFKSSRGMLYVLEDHPDDNTFNPLGEMLYRAAPLNSWLITKDFDYFTSLKFDNNRNGTIEDGVDFSYGTCDVEIDPIPDPTPEGTLIRLKGEISRIRMLSLTSSNGCGSGGATAATFKYGFGATLYDKVPHAFFEIAIPLEEVGGGSPYVRMFLSDFGLQVVPRVKNLLTFDEIASIYAEYDYSNLGYVNPKNDERHEVVNESLACTSFATVMLHRVLHQKQWRSKMKLNPKLHQYLGSQLRADQLNIGGVRFLATNVAKPDLVFSDQGGVAERMGLKRVLRVKAKNFLLGTSVSGLIAGKLYFFDVQRWKTNSAGMEFAKSNGKYIREGHVGFFRKDKAGKLVQSQYSEGDRKNPPGLRNDPFPNWLAGSKYNPSKNHIQEDHIFVTVFEVPELAVE